MVRPAFLYINCKSKPRSQGKVYRVIGTGRQISRLECWKRGPSGESSERSCHHPVTWAWDDSVAPSRPSDRWRRVTDQISCSRRCLACSRRRRSRRLSPWCSQRARARAHRHPTVVSGLDHVGSWRAPNCRSNARPRLPPDSAVPRCNVDHALAGWQIEGHQ